MSVRAQDDGRGAHAHAHEHDHDDDREHAGAGEPIALEDDPDLIVVRSVGIDIGSSTSHLIFSRIVLQRQGARLSSAFVVVDREILHRSPILLTPYSDARTIDTRALGDFVERSYAEAGLAPTDVDTGALIVTGNAALKDNAERIARAIASDAGRFVCATAGPHLESRLAAHGSGAVDRSRSGRTVVNVDIGGGTTKLAIARDGRVLETAALAVGARVVAVDAEGRVTRLEPGAQAAGRAARMRLELGSAVSPADREALAAVLCDALVSVLATRRFAGLALGLLVTEAIELPERID
ncbi:MAG: ethanolamine ammonia-lyase reactivating factor EutA, partial [Chloroflexi bacterium]|nr:ethanolamine ammonia-lyase reactivating factor EutA [Chloroflexota bacterium]